MHILSNLRHFFYPIYRDLALSYGVLELDLPEFELVKSQDAKHGDYQINSAMKLAKSAGMPPRKIAEAFLSRVSCPFLEKIEVAGAGFINLTLKKEYIEELSTDFFKDPRFGFALVGKKQKVIVEYSSPNVAKQMHVGHLRSTIIGESLARIFDFAGHNVLRLNHIGDYGTQFGMLIAYITGEKLSLENADLDQLLIWYKAAKVIFDQDPLFKQRAHIAVVALQSGDTEAVKIWKTICDISRKGYGEIYRILDVDIQERGESFYKDLLPRIIEKMEQKGVVTLSDEAKCVFMEGFLTQEGTPLPLIVQKKDGGYNYATTDLAAIWHRVHEEKADRVIYVVDQGQSLHFQMIFKAALKAGFYDPSKVRLEHVAFGLVLGSDGKKFKTRSGETEKLSDLLQEAVFQAEKILQERHPDLPCDKKQKMAHIIGIDAVKYADLCNIRTRDYHFSYERMLRFEGNTACFLLYAYVRMQSIMRKSNQNQGSFVITHPSERAVLLHLIQFPDLIEELLEDLYPHRLAEYLYLLAEKCNAFFRDCHVIGSPEEQNRMAICAYTSLVLQKGLYLLGLESLDQM